MCVRLKFVSHFLSLIEKKIQLFFWYENDIENQNWPSIIKWSLGVEFFSRPFFHGAYEPLNSATLRNIIVGMLFILGIQGPWITQTLENTNFSFTRFQERSSIKCNYWLIVMHRYLTYTDFFAYCCYTWLFTRNDTNRTLYLMLKFFGHGR